MSFISLRESKLYLISRNLKLEDVSYSNNIACKGCFQAIKEQIALHRKTLKNSDEEKNCARLDLIIRNDQCLNIICYYDPTRLNRQFDIDAVYDQLIIEKMIDECPLNAISNGMIYLLEELLEPFVSNFDKFFKTEIKSDNLIALIAIFSILSIWFDSPQNVVIVVKSQKENNKIIYNIEHMWSDKGELYDHS